MEWFLLSEQQVTQDCMDVLSFVIIAFLALQVEFAAAQSAYRSEGGNLPVIINANNTTPNKAAPARPNIYFSPGGFVAPYKKINFRPDARYNTSAWATFSIKYNNLQSDEWLTEHNLVMVRSIIQVANRLMVGINCHYNWSFIVAGNGAGMVFNKLPIKIYIAGVMGGGPDLAHR